MKEQIMKFLDQIQSPGKTSGPDRMKNLMNRLGNPQAKLKIIHVAGTNGKGSVCAMLNSVLMESAYTVGLFTSPHLIAYNERIQIKGRPISDKDFGAVGIKIKKVCLEMEKDGEEVPRFFEFMAAMAFVYFAEKDLDFVILETGIGGRWDATNIIEKPLLSIITSIGKDHMSFLGDTIEEISREKGGIIKQNCPTVLYDSGKLVYNIIKDMCQSKNSPLFSCKNSVFTDEQYKMEGTTFTVQNPSFTQMENATYKNVSLQLLGKYQSSNALTSLMAIESLRGLGYRMPKEAIYRGLKNTRWPGRMEVVQKDPVIIFDGAHNEESAKAFAASLLGISKKAKIKLLIGVIKGKDYKAILKVLMPIAQTVIVTQSSYAKALPAKELYDQIIKMKQHPKVIVEEDLIKAYELSRKSLDEETILCCLGSLYLIGELKQYLKQQEVNDDKF